MAAEASAGLHPVDLRCSSEDNGHVDTDYCAAELESKEP